MGSIWKGLNGPVKALIIAIPLLALAYGAMHFGLIPGLSSEQSKEVAAFKGENSFTMQHDETGMLPVPNVADAEFADGDTLKPLRMMNWIWYGNAPIFGANGGPVTVENSLMEQYGINLRMTTNNSVGAMKREQLAFIEAYAKGDKQPTQGVHFVTVMGDGLPAYISAMNGIIEKAYGKEYCLKVVGAVALSQNEDCVMGPEAWKENPQLMKGAIISAVIGDGDWGLAVRHAGANGIYVNPDPGTYDPNALNFVPAPNDDFLEAAKEVIAERVVKLKVKDAKGNLTGKTIEHKIDGCATWFPGDINVVKNTDLVKVVSTKREQYGNQMACVVVGCDKWMQENRRTVTNFLTAALIAGNQIKNHDAWNRYACELAPKVFCANAEDCDITAEDWYKYSKPGGAELANTAGVPVMVGGTQVFSLADNKKYFGLKGGNNFYKTVYDYFSNVIEDLNPASFMNDVEKLTPYDDAVDLSYLRNISIDAADAGKTEKVDYSKNQGRTFASRSEHIEFATGSADINPTSEVALEKIFQLLNNAEGAKVQLIGHTDNVGNPTSNQSLSEARARAVKQWLIKRSNNTFPSERFDVEGKGQDQPIASNATPEGRAENRRVQIMLIE